MPEDGRRLVDAAKTWLGTPFHWEASLKGVGCDCRGLLTGIARDLGRPEAETIEANVVGYGKGRIREGELLAGLDRVFVRRPEGSAPEPGDVLAFRIKRRVQHLALAIGDGRLIHARSGDPAQVAYGRIDGLEDQAIHLAGVWAWRDL